MGHHIIYPPGPPCWGAPSSVRWGVPSVGLPRSRQLFPCSALCWSFCSISVGLVRPCRGPPSPLTPSIVQDWLQGRRSPSPGLFVNNEGRHGTILLSHFVGLYCQAMSSIWPRPGQSLKRPHYFWGGGQLSTMCTPPGHGWELPILHYHKITLIYPYPFLMVITHLFSCIIFINDCIYILTGSPGWYLFMIVYVIQNNWGDKNSLYSLNVMVNYHYHGENRVINQ